MLVKGENVLLAEYIALIDEWVLYGCGRMVGSTLTTDTIGTAVAGSQGWDTSEASKHGWTMSLECLVNLEAENILSLPDLRARQIAREKLLIRIVRTAIDGITQYTEEGYAHIVNSSDEGSLNQMNSFSIELKGTGALTQVFTPTNIVSSVNRFQYTGIAGETSFTAVTDINGSPINLTGKKVLGLEVDGVGFSKMITSGTPTDKQFKFVSATGTLEVPVPLDAGIEVFGYYRN